MIVPLAAQLARLDRRIELEILRLRARHQLSLDEFRGLYVSDEHVDQMLLEGGGAPVFKSTPAERPAEGARDDCARWRRLVDAFTLSPLEEDLLLLAAAPELDPRYETLYAYLNNDVTRKWPTVDLARRLLPDLADMSAVLGALAPASTLRARQLVVSIPPPTGRPSLLNAGYALQPCLTHWVHGQSPALALNGEAVRWSSPAELARGDDVAQLVAEPLVRLFDRSREGDGEPPAIALVGREGSGRASIAAATAAALEMPLLHLDLRGIAAGDEGAEALARLTVTLALEPAVVLVDGFEALAGEDRSRAGREARLARAMAQWPAAVPVLFRTADDERWRECAGTRRTIEHRCDGANFGDRIAAWREAARSARIAVPDAELKSLAGRFALTSGAVRATFATARDLAAMNGAAVAGTEEIGTAARLTSDRELGRLATKIECRHDWTDLVLPPIALRRLRELAAAIRHRHVVYGEWGFEARLATSVGIRVLFAGPSGTGKTMAARVIARELSLELYRIDLAGVVSKYIGETEKNLDRIFRAARAASAIVFLDEAEAILGKRSEVKDAHDRYANIEVAYLLQKLEEHDGVVILATNLKRNIDDAFNRRMQYVIDFPRPSEVERERIWRGMFPTRAPLASDVDFAFLGKQFDLAGGDIRNVALDAAFLAAQDGGVIGMSVIVEALARQLAKQGKTPTGSEFRQYQRLLSRRDGQGDGA
jgi:AAA+ superfamily predicted ATPase